MENLRKWKGYIKRISTVIILIYVGKLNLVLFLQLLLPREILYLLFVVFPSKSAFALVHILVHVLGLCCCVRGSVPFSFALAVLFMLLSHLESL